MSNPITKEISLTEQWELIFKLNQIPQDMLNERDREFIRSVTWQFQAHGTLSGRQWMAMERMYDYCTLGHDYDSNKPEEN